MPPLPTEDLVAALAVPGLAVLSGPPGIGRSTLLRAVASAYRGPVWAGGGLAMLRDTPALALARAVRVRLPGHDPALLAEAVRSRVQGGLLVLDDLQWADPATLAALPFVAEHCRVLVALRTPHRLAEAPLRAAATQWYDLKPWSVAEAAALARAVAPGLDQAAATKVAARAGGIPLAITTLAKHPTDTDGDVAFAVAQALADLPRPARTAMAALGLLGRPAPPGLLGPGEADLRAAGLVTAGPDGIAPVSPYQAEVAAGVLDPATRRALHLRLAELVGPTEAARHLAAAGERDRAASVARQAAREARTGGERADALLLACELGTPSTEERIEAARAALAAGRPKAALRVLPSDALSTVTPGETVVRAEAYLLLGELEEAESALAGLGDIDDDPALARVDVLCLLARGSADGRAEAYRKRFGDPPAHPGLRAAIAAVRAQSRQHGWERELADAAAAAGMAGDALTARWCAWLLVEALSADGRMEQAAQTAAAAAHACATDLAYSWQTRFVGAELWCTALRGGAADDVVRRATELLDRSLPPVAHGYVNAAAALAEADGGLLASARRRLRVDGTLPASAAALVDWVGRETAWLDGEPGRATAPVQPRPAPALVAGLRRITAHWAALDSDDPHLADGVPLPPDVPSPVRETLTAWAVGTAFDRAAGAWHDVALREEVRCLLAQGLLSSDVPALLAAERVATDAGLVVLLGRTHRALRQHGVRRDNRTTRTDADSALTDRERDVLRLVARGEPTRRIAGQLGISRETVETHVRSGMRKLGAHTRTEAAARVLAELT